ncbi:hypothetical protein PO80_19360 [Vibrio parahaemolyticus]|uniref:hypothetical protein n=1 Tax=Vibrio parahaemolyticus TaxID=670 RepID=UPI00054273E6|nr:hypothetical protein [Vibrio parahaemolyticus]KHF13176.1 hypothetical protein PO80_19360 [Vibrio parahaemolyticus]MDS1791872.1 hypothetical protein [Vibrio parahaemolyticus]OTV95967.1 hypothetical protein BA739_24010 [Vibrio parahaemolyticus]OTW00130.1 hypothetical protein BA740_24010 [Vibrio parahaemolyticus]
MMKKMSDLVLILAVLGLTSTSQAESLEGFVVTATAEVPYNVPVTNDLGIPYNFTIVNQTHTSHLLDSLILEIPMDYEYNCPQNLALENAPSFVSGSSTFPANHTYAKHEYNGDPNLLTFKFGFGKNIPNELKILHPEQQVTVRYLSPQSLGEQVSLCLRSIESSAKVYSIGNSMAQ